MATNTTRLAPMYVRDPYIPGDEQGYVALPQLIVDKERAARVVKIETAHAASAMERARAVADVLQLEQMVDEAILHIRSVAEHAEQPAA